MRVLKINDTLGSISNKSKGSITINNVEYPFNNSTNLYNKSVSSFQGGFISTDGRITTFDGWSVSEFIAIRSSKMVLKVYQQDVSLGQSAHYNLFDENKNIIATIVQGDVDMITIDSLNAKYIKISIRDSNKDVWYLGCGEDAPSNYIGFNE